MKCLLLTSILPDYRLPVFLALCDKLGNQFQLAVSVSEAREGYKLQQVPSEFLVPVENKYLMRGKFQVQTGMWKQALKADVVILEMNPRILSTWALLVLRKIRRKPIVMWGHAWPRSGPNSKSDWLRNKMRSFGDVVLVYTETQAQELRRKMPKKQVMAAPNSLYYRAEMEQNLSEWEKPSQRTDFIFVGRLIDEKKPMLLLKAFMAASERLDKSTRLVFVGEGPERAVLEAEAKKMEPGRVIFTGHQAGSDALRPLYGSAIASMSPGYVGLSITQSFSFGVPMVISRDEPHAPEIEAAVEGQNSVFFETDSLASLGDQLVQVSSEKAKWAKRGPDIIRDCMERYSVEKMSSRFIEAASLACGGRRFS